MDVCSFLTYITDILWLPELRHNFEIHPDPDSRPSIAFRYAYKWGCASLSRPINI
jgi:hypothetical protein